LGLLASKAIGPTAVRGCVELQAYPADLLTNTANTTALLLPLANKYHCDGLSHADLCTVGAFIGTYTFPQIIDSLGGPETYGGKTVSQRPSGKELIHPGRILDWIRLGCPLGCDHVLLHREHQAGPYAA
jgi:hypothetical protein